MSPGHKIDAMKRIEKRNGGEGGEEGITFTFESDWKLCSEHRERTSTV
jgi:hypothetical protein